MRHAANLGLAEAIRASLKAGPLTANQIAKRLNKSPDYIRSALSTMLNVTGGIVAFGPMHGRLYQLYEAPTKEDNPRIAGRITIGRGFCWGRGWRQG